MDSIVDKENSAGLVLTKITIEWVCDCGLQNGKRLSTLTERNRTRLVYRDPDTKRLFSVCARCAKRYDISILTEFPNGTDWASRSDN